MKNYLSRFVSHIKVFSFGYAVWELCAYIGRKVLPKFPCFPLHRILQRKERYIISWALSEFADLIEKYQNVDFNSYEFDTNNAPIWVCWLQGENQAPSLVNKLIGQMRNFAVGHPVIVLNEYNIGDYCTISPHIWEKYRAGLMPPQQFADITRVNLLAQKGGLWIDGTMLITRAIPEEVFKLPMYNVKNISGNFLGKNVVCDSTKWQCYFIAAHPNTVTYSFISDCLSLYWEKYDTLIDYFLISYLAKIARENIPAATTEYGLIPDNNYKCELLSDYLMRDIPCSEETKNYFFADDTWLYKLSWKIKYPVCTASGKPTLFSSILKMLED